MGKESDLLEAARTGNIEYIRSFIGKIRSSTSRPKSHKKRIIFQSFHGHSYKTGVVSNRGLGLNCCDSNGETPLHLAALNNHRSAVATLMNGDAHVNIRDNQGCLPIHLAAWTGNADICKVLLTPLNANEVNSQNKAGDTALHIASQYGHVAVVRLLLQHQANPMIRNLKGESSLDLAAFYGRLETVSLLVNDQPALLQQIQHSHSPLHLASRNGQKEVVRKLLQSGYNINSKTRCGSALHEAAIYGKVEVMKILLQSGIDKSIKDKNNQTVEQFLESQNSAMANTLLLILKGRENIYHSLSPTPESEPQSRVSTASHSSCKHRVCKHGKTIKDSTHQRRTRERSSSGQTSGSGSPTLTTPPSTRSSKASGFRRTSNSSTGFLSDQIVGDQPLSISHQTITPNRYIPIDQQKSQKRCTCQHSKQGNQSANPRNTSSDKRFNRHQSCPGPFHPSARSLSSTHAHGANIAANVIPERFRHKSSSVQGQACGDNYIMLSDTTTSLHDQESNNHVYHSIMQTPMSGEHLYVKVRKGSVETSDDEPVYDSVPKPWPIHTGRGTLGDVHFTPLSPPSPSVFNYQCSMSSSFESQDSVYNSPGSLSPEFNEQSSRKYLGHIYVNLSNYRSTPDLNKIISEAPKKPPRTETPDAGYISQAGCKSADYACLEIDPHSISKSQEIIRSNGSSPFQLSPTQRLVLSVPPHNHITDKHFIFPPTTLLANEEDEEDDSHEYENMAAILHQHKSKQPPKAMPRKSKSKVTSPGSSSVEGSILTINDDEPTLVSGSKGKVNTINNNNNQPAREDQGASPISSPVVYSTEL